MGNTSKAERLVPLDRRALIERISAATGLEQSDVKATVDCLFDTVVTSISESEPIRIIGVGEFYPHDLLVDNEPKRRQRSPKTIRFRLSDSSQEVLNDQS